MMLAFSSRCSQLFVFEVFVLLLMSHESMHKFVQLFRILLEACTYLLAHLLMEWMSDTGSSKYPVFRPTQG